MGERIKVDTSKVWYAADDLDKKHDWNGMWGGGRYFRQVAGYARTLAASVRAGSSASKKLYEAADSIDDLLNNSVPNFTNKISSLANACKQAAVGYEDVENRMELDFTGKRNDDWYMNFFRMVQGGYTNLSNYWSHVFYSNTENRVPDEYKWFAHEFRDLIEGYMHAVIDGAITSIPLAAVGAIAGTARFAQSVGSGIISSWRDYATSLPSELAEKYEDNEQLRRLSNLFSLGKSVHGLTSRKFGFKKADEDLSWWQNLKRDNLKGFELDIKKFDDFEPESAFDVLDNAKSIVEGTNDIAENEIWKDDLENVSGGGGGGGICR